MAITIDDFNKIWASTSPLTPYTFSDANYKQGWNFVGNTPPSRQMWDAFMQNADEKLKYLYQHEDVPIGHEYFTFNPNIPQGSLPLFGGEYDRATYPDLWNWVQQQAGYLKTEAEWQTLATANNGNVPFYSDGDGSTTFRVPSLKCWVKSANGTVTEVGSYLQAGLPNITGGFDIRATSSTTGSVENASGSFSISDIKSGLNILQTVSGTNYRNTVTINASNSSAIYGNSTTVQPESIVGLWLVKAYGTIVDTGTIDEQQYIDDRYNAMKTYVDGKFESVVASGSDYIRYDSGLQICWGRYNVSSSSNPMEQNITYPVPFLNTAYPSVGTDSRGSASMKVYHTNDSSTGFTLAAIGITSGSMSGGWVAVGYWK